MCGRYASRVSALSSWRSSACRGRGRRAAEPDYNVAPTKPVYAVLTGPSQSDDDGRAGPSSLLPRPGPRRRARVMRWGLVPFWAKDLKIGSRMINARTETAARNRRSGMPSPTPVPVPGRRLLRMVAAPGSPSSRYFIRRDGGRWLWPAL